MTVVPEQATQMKPSITECWRKRAEPAYAQLAERKLDSTLECQFTKSAISLIAPAIISHLLRGFDLRNLRDALRLSSIGQALEAIRTAIHTSPMGPDVQFALEDR